VNSFTISSQLLLHEGKIWRIAAECLNVISSSGPSQEITLEGWIALEEIEILKDAA